MEGDVRRYIWKLVEVERIGLYVSFCRGMEEKGLRKRIISKEKGGWIYYFRRKILKNFNWFGEERVVVC